MGCSISHLANSSAFGSHAVHSGNKGCSKWQRMINARVTTVNLHTKQFYGSNLWVLFVVRNATFHTWPFLPPLAVAQCTVGTKGVVNDKRWLMQGWQLGILSVHLHTKQFYGSNLSILFIFRNYTSNIWPTLPPLAVTQCTVGTKGLVNDKGWLMQGWQQYESWM